MAGLFADGFDHYATADLTGKWTTLYAGTNQSIATAIDAAYGRNSTAGVRFRADSTSATAKPLLVTVGASGATAIIGCAFKSDNIGGVYGSGDKFAFNDASQVFGNYQQPALLALGYNSAPQIRIRPNADGTLSVLTDANTVLGTTANALSSDVWYYLEWKVLLHASAGTVDLKVNGASWLSLSGQDTITTGSALWNNVYIGKVMTATSSDILWYYDDIFVCDGSGSLNNDWFGDVTVSAKFPNANGTTSGWTRSTGSDQYATIDEASANGDTDYNSTATVNAVDTVNVESAPTGASILAVQVLTYGRKTDVGTSAVAPVIRHGGTDYAGTGIGIGGTTYSFQRTLYDTNPGTSAAWVEADFNAAEFGYKKTA